MPSDEEGNKGIKRKSQESAEGSANKHLRPSTSSGITHDDQAKRNVKKTTWMKWVNIDDSGAKPQCILCENYLQFYIKPKTLKNHLKKKHPHILEKNEIRKNESPDWIFCYYTPSKIPAHMTCSICTQEFEVLEFKGEFVKHFDDAHEEMAKLRSQESHEDAEEVERRLTTDFIKYLHDAFANKYTKEADHDARRKAWWMKYVKKVENRTLFCNIPDCVLNEHPFPIHIKQHEFQLHVQKHWKTVKLGRNVNIWDYFSFENYLLRCKRCNILLQYQFDTGFVAHLKRIHNIFPIFLPDDESIRQGTNNEETTNEYVHKLLLYLIGNYAPRK